MENKSNEYTKPFSLRLLARKKKKLEIISKKNARSLNKQIEFIINQFIDDYEKVNGKIELKEEE